MILEGFSYLLGDDVNTDLIISGRYKFSISDIKELSKHILEDVDSQFYSRIKPGKSILIGGKNFGMGSSREQAPLVIKEAGVVCVVARSFARIFYRNSINIGLPLIEAETVNIKEQDELSIDLEKGILRNISQDYEVKILPLPSVMVKLLLDGGLVKHFKKYGKIKI
ncbi:3-isopropylmalate dehydratase [bacterium]|nr:3-isopropylmalate dehydratase [bacterium]